MGRKRKNAVFNFFSCDNKRNVSTCQVENCGHIVKGQHGTNLIFHLSSKHPDEYAIVVRRNNLAENDSNIENDENLPSTSSEIPRTDKKTENLHKECVDLVTVHGRPFSMMDDKAFKNILGMIPLQARAIQSINSHSIRALVKEKANEIRNDIAKKLRDKLLCIKVDSATCRYRNFLGINVQYVENAKIKLFNLGVIELHSRSTADYLKEKLLYVLRKYNIAVTQIYSVTSDNGSNMIKMAKLLNDETTSEIELLGPSSTEHDSSDSEEDADDHENSTLNETITLHGENEPSHIVTSIRCAAHTLQLAVEDALKEENTITLLEEVRAVVRRLRTPTMTNLLKALKKKKPILDCPTRWHSKVDMLERLMLFRDCCSTTTGEIPYLSDSTWDVINDIVKALKPAKILTKKLQSEQLTIGDFYYNWMKCKLELGKMNTELSVLISNCMKEREKKLFENETFVSALYLDVRFNVVLSPAEIETAIAHLSNVWTRIVKLQKDIYAEEELPADKENTPEMLEEPDEMEKMLAESERIKRKNAEPLQDSANISIILKELYLNSRISSQENILAFWSKKKTSNPQLYKLACTVLAAPATQVSVERLFSSLKFVLSALRYNLNDSIVEDILIVRNNKDIK